MELDLGAAGSHHRGAGQRLTKIDGPMMGIDLDGVDVLEIQIVSLETDLTILSNSIRKKATTPSLPGEGLEC